MSKLWIIADDYGLGVNHDDVILSLISSASINATSVLADICTEESAFKLRRQMSDYFRVGLHLNLTFVSEGNPRKPGKKTLLAMCVLGMGKSIAGDALRSQFNRFVKLFGKAPDFIDGHEHCHAFPGVRSEVLRLANEYDIPVRCMTPLISNTNLKSLVISNLGRRISKEAAQVGVKTNWRFGGVLPVHKPSIAIIKLRKDLSTAAIAAESAPGEIWFMVHPGDESDPVQIPGHPGKLRRLEAEFLSSEGCKIYT